MLTSPCNEYALTPHFYIVKLGFTGVYIIFLFLLENIDCGYSLENKKIVKKNYLKIVIFKAVKNRSILHGRVFVMATSPESSSEEASELSKTCQVPL